MGYDTKLIFVTGKDVKKFTGYCCIEAVLKMGCIDYGHISPLIKKKPDGNYAALWEQIKDFNNLRDEIYTKEGGDYNHEFEELDGKEKKRKLAELSKMESALEKTFPYIYFTSGNNADYCDDYGTPLIMVELKELRDAIVKDQARLTNTGEYDTGYRRFDMAIRMIDMFLNKEIWGTEPVKAILWGC